VQRVRLLAGGRLAAAGDGDDVDVAEATHGIQMMRPDESGPDQAHSDTLHSVSSKCLQRGRAQMFVRFISSLR
jgi:hypothetical protein